NLFTYSYNMLTVSFNSLPVLITFAIVLNIDIATSQNIHQDCIDIFKAVIGIDPEISSHVDVLTELFSNVSNHKINR
ncbi:hypothetical protein NL492_27640, partial [Klebsiella pneumoniae]|nr:hypothetical protein [Klebsiella pneumoniae]